MRTKPLLSVVSLLALVVPCALAAGGDEPLLPSSGADAAAPLDEAPLSAPPIASEGTGRALFLHTWTPDDPWSLEGNGLGPVSNASSCVACHAQGGVGGAGAFFRNVVTLREVELTDDPFGLGGLTTATRRRARPSKAPKARFPVASARNTPALFGAGLIDRIDDEVLEFAAGLRHADHPEIQGQLARDGDGHIARFGWKGEVRDLADFVGQACALELGLNVPGHSEAPPPAGALVDDDLRSGLDLDEDQVASLVAFVAALPAPREETGGASRERGARVFEEIGCAACHLPTLDEVPGLYSDLLLHDMGASLSDGGSFYGAVSTAASDRLWRTPPLWGVRDSGPWLHDGRAMTLRAAVEQHDGEAARVREAFTSLPAQEQQHLLDFLESLVAPDLL